MNTLEGTITVMSDDPEPLIDRLWLMGLDVAASVHPQSPQGRILGVMAASRESVITMRPGWQTCVPIDAVQPAAGRTVGPPTIPSEEKNVDTQTRGEESDERRQEDAALTRRQIIEDINRRADEYLHRHKQINQEQERNIRQ